MADEAGTYYIAADQDGIIPELQADVVRAMHQQSVLVGSGGPFKLRRTPREHHMAPWPYRVFEVSACEVSFASKLDAALLRANEIRPVREVPIHALLGDNYIEVIDFIARITALSKRELAKFAKTSYASEATGETHRAMLEATEVLRDQHLDESRVLVEQIILHNGACGKRHLPRSISQLVVAKVARPHLSPQVYALLARESNAELAEAKS